MSHRSYNNAKRQAAKMSKNKASGDVDKACSYNDIMTLDT